MAPCVAVSYPAVASSIAANALGNNGFDGWVRLTGWIVGCQPGTHRYSQGAGTDDQSYWFLS